MQNLGLDKLLFRAIIAIVSMKRLVSVLWNDYEEGTM